MFQYLNIYNYYALWYAGTIGLMFYLIRRLINRLIHIDKSMYNTRLKRHIANYNVLLVKLQLFCNDDKNKSIIANLMNPDLNIFLLINWFIFDKRGKIPLLSKTNYNEKMDDTNSDDTNSDDTISNTNLSTEELYYFDTYDEYLLNERIFTLNLFNTDNEDRVNVIEIRSGGKVYHTNIAQLNFFHWLVENNIYDYVIENREEMELEMKQDMPQDMPLDMPQDMPQDMQQVME